MGRVNIVGTPFVLWLNVSSERISATEFWLEIKKDRFATALKPNSIIRISRKCQHYRRRCPINEHCRSLVFYCRYYYYTAPVTGTYRSNDTRAAR